MSENIVEMLDELHNLRSAGDAIRLAKEEAVEKAIPPEIRAAVDEYRRLIADVELEFADKAEVANQKAGDLEKKIKDAVVAHGKTVKSEYMQAVWVKGRVKWDNERLEGYALTHPEIALLRNEGEPSVSLRVVK